MYTLKKTIKWLSISLSAAAVSACGGGSGSGTTNFGGNGSADVQVSVALELPEQLRTVNQDFNTSITVNGQQVSTRVSAGSSYATFAFNGQTGQTYNATLLFFQGTGSNSLQLATGNANITTTDTSVTVNGQNVTVSGGQAGSGDLHNPGNAGNFTNRYWRQEQAVGPQNSLTQEAAQTAIDQTGNTLVAYQADASISNTRDRVYAVWQNSDGSQSGLPRNVTEQVINSNNTAQEVRLLAVHTYGTKGAAVLWESVNNCEVLGVGSCLNARSLYASRYVPNQGWQNAELLANNAAFLASSQANNDEVFVLVRDAGAIRGKTLKISGSLNRPALPVITTNNLAQITSAKVHAFTQGDALVMLRGSKADQGLLCNNSGGCSNQGAPAFHNGQYLSDLVLEGNHSDAAISVDYDFNQRRVRASVFRKGTGWSNPETVYQVPQQQTRWDLSVMGATVNRSGVAQVMFLDEAAVMHRQRASNGSWGSLNTLGQTNSNRAYGNVAFNTHGNGHAIWSVPSSNSPFANYMTYVAVYNTQQGWMSPTQMPISGSGSGASVAPRLSLNEQGVASWSRIRFTGAGGVPQNWVNQYQ